MKIITLLSDFGLKDPYVAEMKATILSICPEARIIDISHEIKKFDIRMGAFVLTSASQFFPKGTVHVAAVDPEVGGKRRGIIIETRNGIYVGPDNGLLILAAKNDGILNVYSITNRKYMRKDVSDTFHGRDIFSSVAAHLANGVSVKDIGENIEDYKIPEFGEAKITKDSIDGEVMHVDDFGNIITNVSKNLIDKLEVKIGSKLCVELNKKKYKIDFLKTYSDTGKGDMLVLIGSHNFFEISVNQEDAAKRLKVKSGDKIKICLRPSKDS